MFAIFVRNLLKIFVNFRNVSNNLWFRPNPQKSNGFFIKSFAKYAQQMHFSQFSLETFWEFSRDFPRFPISCMVPGNEQRINARFVNFFEKLPKIMYFFPNILKKSLCNFRKVSPPEKSCPRPFSQLLTQNSIFKPFSLRFRWQEVPWSVDWFSDHKWKSKVQGTTST